MVVLTVNVFVPANQLFIIFEIENFIELKAVVAVVVVNVTYTI